MRAVATGAIPGIGALGAIIAYVGYRTWTSILLICLGLRVWTYLPTDAPNFHKGNSINLAAALAVIALTAVGMVYLKLENMKRERGERDYRLEGKTEEEIRNLGYRHPKFRYQL